MVGLELLENKEACSPMAGDPVEHVDNNDDNYMYIMYIDD